MAIYKAFISILKKKLNEQFYYMQFSRNNINIRIKNEFRVIEVDSTYSNTFDGRIAVTVQQFLQYPLFAVNEYKAALYLVHWKEMPVD